ncbi:Glutathione-dependent formaldehyde-activating enzyme/centromere protein V [Penicillium herquei]|nr:Glutathione-dependent formaldehyde-activating enzyme/centromere protein V [Penicillium herquei]
MFAHPSWMSRYRAQTGTELSDVDTTDYDWRDILDGDMIPDPQKLSPWFLMSRIRPTKVLLFHELCWSRLLQYFDGEKIDLDRIFEVCRHRWLDLWIFYMVSQGFQNLNTPQAVLQHQVEHSLVFKSSSDTRPKFPGFFSQELLPLQPGLTALAFYQQR